MDRHDLETVDGRLAIAEQVFRYPAEPHSRRHGPTGYVDYESYRDWVRDEFSFRCVFSLVREQWISRPGNFDIDHLEPRAVRPDLECEYDNLLYLSHQVNLIRNKKAVPNPCEIALGRSLYVVASGERVGEIEGLDAQGHYIILVLRLDSEDATRFRRNMLELLRSLAIHDEVMFRRYVGFPPELPDLRPPRRHNRGNTRPEGVTECCHARFERRELPEWY